MTATMNTVEDLRLDELPESMRIAQAAVQSDEVQAIIQQLSKYNLGVCMPHMHIEEGEFVELPVGMTSLEKESLFIPVPEAEQLSTLPVAWRWENGSVVTAGSCHILMKRCGK